MKHSHTVKYLRIAPKKLSLISKTVKGKTVKNAVDYLGVQKQKGGDFISKALMSAINNIEATGVKTDDAKILAVLVQKGPVFMRRWIRARGRATPKRKPTSHLTVIIGTGKAEVKDVKKEKAEKKATTKSK